MTAKQNDILYKALNIGIIAAVIVGIWFLYKWFKNHHGGLGDTLFGSAKQPSSGDGHSDNNGGPSDLVTRIAKKAEADLKNAPHTLVVGIQLDRANKSAKQFDKKQGTNVIINKAIKAANDLSDKDFLLAVKGWLALGDIPEFYDTPLATNVTNTANHSIFLTRYGVLTGRINSTAAYSAHSTAKA